MKKGYQGVQAQIGMPGSGKTHALVEIGAKAMEAGRPVFANDGFLIGAEPYYDFRGFVRACSTDGAVVLLDEAPLYFNSRKWNEFPDGVFYQLSQIRKDGAELHYSAIDESYIDVNLRRITFWYWHWRQVVPGISGRLLHGSLWPPDKFRKAKQRPFRQRFVMVNPKVAALYNTRGKVAAPMADLGLQDKKMNERWTKPETEPRPSAAGGDPSGVPAVEGGPVRVWDHGGQGWKAPRI